MTDWRALNPLPLVSPWSKGKRSYTWEQRRDEYAELPKEPLIVRAQLATPMVVTEQHLDALLAAAAITDHPHPSKWDAAAVVPLPLELLWVDDGWPLWAAMPLRPVGGTQAREYWHKRYPADRADLGNKRSASTTSGRYRDWRTPMSVASAHHLEAMAIGNLDEVARLLRLITHVGKKGAMGYGRVATWHVERAAFDVRDLLRARAVPVDCPLANDLDGVSAPNIGWTPPYWYAPRWRTCKVAS